MKAGHRNWHIMAGRLPWILTAWSCLGLGAAGALLPLLPTTPFLLLAAWAAPKGSPRLNVWLHNHPVFGPSLKAWRTGRRIPRKAKLSALVMLAVSWTVLWLLGAAQPLLILLALLFLTVGTYIYSRPSAEDSNPRRAGD